MNQVVSRLVAVLVVSLAGVRAGAAQAPDEGEALYRQHCRKCHGARGTPTERMLGLYPTLKSLSDSAFQARVSADSIVTVLARGSGEDMKPFGDKMTREQMTAVANYVRTLKRAP